MTHQEIRPWERWTYRVSDPGKIDSPRYQTLGKIDSPGYQTPGKIDSPRYQTPGKNDSTGYQTPGKIDSPGYQTPGSHVLAEFVFSLQGLIPKGVRYLNLKFEELGEFITKI